MCFVQLPFLVYHGDQQERVEKRSKLYSKPVPVYRRLKTCPVVITSYDLVMLDRQFLSNVQWHLIIVDEGHRIRNLHCRLFRFTRDGINLFWLIIIINVYVLLL